MREFEAFVLNELCHFTGPSAIPCTATRWGYLCRVPYRIEPEERRSGEDKKLDIGAASWAEDGYLCGATGCGLSMPCIGFGGEGNHTLKARWTGNYADLCGAGYL